MIELMGKNYQMVQKIETALLANPKPFYNSFGNPDDVRFNINSIAAVEGISVDDIKVTFKAAPERYVRALILEIPDCVTEMDSRYFVITYIGHDYEFFSCELMEGEDFALRCNEDMVIKVFSNTPSIDDIWEVIINRYEKRQIDGLYFSVLYSHDLGQYSYILFDNNSELFLNHWFGTTDIIKTVHKVNEVEYLIYSATGSDNMALFRAKDGEIMHVQYGDDSVLRDIRAVH